MARETICPGFPRTIYYYLSFLCCPYPHSLSKVSWLNNLHYLYNLHIALKFHASIDLVIVTYICQMPYILKDIFCKMSWRSYPHCDILETDSESLSDMTNITVLFVNQNWSLFYTLDQWVSSKIVLFEGKVFLLFKLYYPCIPENKNSVMKMFIPFIFIFKIKIF